MSFFLNDTGTSEIYTNSHALALRDALPLCADGDARHEGGPVARDPRPREGSASAIHRREPRQDARAICVGECRMIESEDGWSCTCCGAPAEMKFGAWSFGEQDRKSTRLNSSH